ncbi:MAG: SLBB domain-containing protein [Bacteroidetes bacterium]|nr:SLBB domain-containing protein [Bacteroidota bacterium]
MKKIIFFVAVVTVLNYFNHVIAQSKAVLKAEAESQLQTMSPDQIDAAIKQYGLTRSEAESKAQELGINLDDYLKGLSSTVPQQNVPLPTPAVVNSQQAPTINDTLQTAVERAAVSSALDAQKKQTALLTKEIEPGEQELFGQSLFKTTQANFEPSPSISDKDYVVGAGDVLKISLWGDAEFTSEFTVDKDGRIIVPSVGPIFVSGYTLENAKKRIEVSMSKSYSGLVAVPPRIFMDLSISKLRPIRVFIMGEVLSPGGYFVSNFGSVFNSLFAVGGPKVSGSMRDILLVRNNKTVAHVDLYDYLLGATKTNDIRVNDNDIIYVPLRGKTVRITGNVRRTFRFELLPNENLKKLIEFSGGLKSDVYRDRIQIDRIVPFKERVKDQPDRKIIDVDFKDIAEGKKDFQLEDGDIVTLFSITNQKLNYVTITGDVWHPGTFQLDKIKTIKDLVLAADGAQPTAFLDKAELSRKYIDERQVVISIDLKKALQGDPKHNLVLQSWDSLRIYSKYEINPQQTVTLQGSFKEPGVYPYADSLTLYNVLYTTLADTALRKHILLERADLIRQNPDRRTSRIVSFNPWKIFTTGEGDTTLLGFDKVILYSRSTMEIVNDTVEIFGKVKNPGRYRLSENMTLKDLLMQAGGYTIDAWAVNAEVARKERIFGGKDSLIRIYFTDLPNFFDTTTSRMQQLQAPAGRFLLKGSDQVFIRPNPDFMDQQLVSITGEVMYPGKYALSKRNESVSDLIKRAGGINPVGYARGGKLYRYDDTLRFNLEKALNNPKGDDDIILQMNDVINIPHKPNTVMVTGAVENPGIYGYVAGESRNFYLDRAGDVTDSADFVLVMYPEGYTEKTSLRWLFGDNPSIPDGTIIHVAKIKSEPPKDQKNGEDVDIGKTLRDTLTYMASVITLVILIRQL